MHGFLVPCVAYHPCASACLAPPLLSPHPTLKYSVMIPEFVVPQGKRRTERLWNQCVNTASKTVPSNIERYVFRETRLTAYRLKAAA